MSVYYNENASYPAQWLRNLIEAGHLPAGDVDERSIEDVQATDLRDYDQCHFFAGIGGWPLALRMAGWPGGRPVWTGSCPCQPLSSAGQRKGHADRRHLWPAFQRLIAECGPATVFGEQVASKDGREWFAAVRSDLERMGYACGGADMPAASVGAPHIRQRLWWVAHANISSEIEYQEKRIGVERDQARRSPDLGDSRSNGGLGNSEHNGSSAKLKPSGAQEKGRLLQLEGSSGMGNAHGAGPQGRRERPDQHADQRPPWASSELIPCADGKARITQPGLHPLAHGVPGRVGRLRAYGNAIVPSLAAEFVSACMECRK